MATSPEADPQPEAESVDMRPSPPRPSPPLVPRPAQESASLTTPAPSEAAHPGQATLTSTPPPEQATSERSEADVPLPPIEEGADPLPVLPHPPEVAPAASAALKATSTEKPASPSPRREDVAVESSPDAAASTASPPPSPQIGEASPEDASPPPAPTPTPPATISRASPDPPTAEAAAMASQEPARPPPAPESMDADAQTAPAPPTPPLESAPEGLSSQHQPRPPSPEMAPPLFENSVPEETPSPVPPPAESTHALLDAAADDVEAVASEGASASPPALEAMDGETATAPGVPPALESGVEVSFQEPVQTSSSLRMEAESCSPEMAPPGFENFKSQWLAVPPPTHPVGFTESLIVAAATNAVAVGMMLVSASGSMPALEAMDAEMDISPGLQPPLKSGAEGQLQQQLLGSSSPMAEVAPCSPDMPPPGFENCKSSWLPLPTLAPPAETTYTLPDVVATNEAKVMFAEKACSVPALEATDVGKDTALSLLPQFESGAGVSLQGPPPRSPSPTIQAAPCSPDMEPPGFENLKSSQLQLPSPPLLQTACINIMQDSATTVVDEVVAVDVHMEAPQTAPALKAMYVHMVGASALPPPLESGAGGSVPHELPPSHTAHGTAFSLEMVTSGFENVESLQPLLSASVLPLVQTPDALADAETKKTVTVEQVCHPLHVAGEAEEPKGSILPPPVENGCEGPLPHLEPQASSPVAQAVPSSPEIAPAGFENLESSQPTSSHLAETMDPSPQAPATKSVTVKSEKMGQPSSSLQATCTDLENAIALQSPSKSREGSLPQPQHQPSSPSVQDAPCSPEMAPPGYENLDSLEQLPPPPLLCTKFEIGQMVCGHCRELLAYPRGAVHVQCFGCLTVNLVLEEHQVGKAYCGQCETLLMYPFGAPAVRCMTCLFVTEIGDLERNVRRRISSMEEGGSPHLKEQTHQELAQA